MADHKKRVICDAEYCYSLWIGARTKPDWKMTSHGIWYYIEERGTIVISYSHPEARTKECLLHYGLIDAVREILSNDIDELDTNTAIGKINICS
jgi:hypothetical protein